MPRHAAILAFIVLALAACSQRKTEEPPAAPVAPDEVRTPAVSPPAPAPAPVAAGGTVGGDGSEITLSPLLRADFEANELKGELSCGFQTDPTRQLLHATGYVASKDPALGLVKVGTYVERIAAPGGYDGMVKGATFSGQGKTITIALTGKAIGDGESPAYPATLTYDRADGARRVIEGTWTCGP